MVKACFRQEDVSCKLLGDGTRSAYFASAGQLFLDGSCHTYKVESVVIPERFILERNERVHEVVRHIAVLDYRSVLARVNCFEFVSILVVDLRTLAEV